MMMIKLAFFGLLLLSNGGGFRRNDKASTMVMAAPASHLILSEIFPNPGIFSDSQGEYIEIFNPTTSTIHFDNHGYEVCDLVRCHTLTGSLPSGAYYMACSDATTYPSCNTDTSIQLNNGGDTVFLKDTSTGTTLDTVMYGSASAEESYVRDTSDVTSSWSWSTVGGYTPGTGSLTAATSGTPAPTTPAPTTAPPTMPPVTAAPTSAPPPPCANHVLISQVLYDEPGGATNKEWVELYNPTPHTVDLSGYSMLKTTTSGSTTAWNFLSGSTIAGGGRFILGNSGFFAEYGFYPDVEDFGHALTNSGMILTLQDGTGTNIDEVGWETGIWSSLVAADGQSIIRLDGTDIHNNASDWEVAVTPQVGGQFYPCSAVGGGIGNGCWGDHLLLGKVHYDSVQASEEFVEFYNPTKNTVSLAGYTLSDNAGTHTIASGSIPSLGRFIIAKSGFQAKFGFAPNRKNPDGTVAVSQRGELPRRCCTSTLRSFS